MRLDVVLPAIGQVVLWMWIVVDHEVLVASGCGGPEDKVSGQMKWTYLNGGSVMEGIHNEEHSRM